MACVASMNEPDNRAARGVCRCKGVGYLELMLTVALVALLGGIGIPSYSYYKKRLAIQQAITDVRLIEQSLARYEAQSEQGGLPDSLAELGIAIVNDPWGNPYEYLNLDDLNKGGKASGGKARKDRSLHPINSDYDLYSMGPDGRSVAPLTASPSRDDIVRAGNGSFVGTAADYVP
jgi:general secretion pathway protein G